MNFVFILIIAIVDALLTNYDPKTTIFTKFCQFVTKISTATWPQWLMMLLMCQKFSAVSNNHIPKVSSTTDQYFEFYITLCALHFRGLRESYFRTVLPLNLNKILNSIYYKIVIINNIDIQIYCKFELILLHARRHIM